MLFATIKDIAICQHITTTFICQTYTKFYLTSGLLWEWDPCNKPRHQETYKKYIPASVSELPALPWQTYTTTQIFWIGEIFLSSYYVVSNIMSSEIYTTVCHGISNLQYIILQQNIAISPYLCICVIWLNIFYMEVSSQQLYWERHQSATQKLYLTIAYSSPYPILLTVGV